MSRFHCLTLLPAYFTHGRNRTRLEAFCSLPAALLLFGRSDAQRSPERFAGHSCERFTSVGFWQSRQFYPRGYNALLLANVRSVGIAAVDTTPAKPRE